MANTLLTIDMITREILMVLENNLVFTKQVNRQYDDQFVMGGAQHGTTLRIRLPQRFTVSTGTTLVNQDTEQQETTLTVATQKHVGVRFTSAELTLSMEEFSDRIIVPAVAPLANQIDLDGLALYKDVYNAVGTAGTTPNALLTYLQAGALMSHNATPRDGNRSVIINPDAEVSIVDALKGLFQSSSEIDRQYKEGQMGMAAGFKWGMDQNVAVHTVATHAGTPLSNGADQTGASIISDGWTSTTLNVGDVLTFAGTNAVNPVSKVDTGSLMQFTVTAQITDTAGAITIPISPAVVTTGAYQNVTAAIADGSAIVVKGATGVTTPQNLAFHRDAFTLATADLEVPQGTDFARRMVHPQTGISVRVVRDYDISEDRFPMRIDVLYGWLATRPELACRVYG